MCSYLFFFMLSLPQGSITSNSPSMGYRYLLLLLLIGATEAAKNESLGRRDFPQGFIFGTASAAYQYEGAAKLDGRGSSIWDTYALNSGQIADGSSGEVAVDQYHLYKGDVDLMYNLGLDAYRFSISWPRIFPNGSGTVNQAGVDYYNNLIDTLVAAGLAPVITLYHFDLPQALQDAYGGWLSPRIITDYSNFAELCFAAFGDRVKHWITFNEPHGFILTGYDFGMGAPGRCSVHLPNSTCTVGNSSTEPYIVAHNVLLSHSAASTTYKTKFQEKQGGQIGITLDMIWIEPMSNSTQDSQIVQVALDFQVGWFLDPFYFGDYPSSMREKVKERLPFFSKNESEALKGSLDFVGINHYTTYYAWDISNNTLAKSVLNNDTFVDAGVLPFPSMDGVPISNETGASEWLYVVPWGIRKAVNYIKDRYGNPQVIITENGIDEANLPHNSLEEALQDQKRIDYHREYLKNLLAAIKEDGCNVTGYFIWSLLDNWEWTSGFTVRFGLHYVDYKSPGLPRYAKKSADWFQQFLLPY